MKSIDFTGLDLIPEVLNKIEILENKLSTITEYIKPTYDLSKRADVRKYLNKSESTLSRWIKEGELREGYHYYRDLKGSKSIITFVSGAIEEFKKEKTKWNFTIETGFYTSM